MNKLKYLGLTAALGLAPFAAFADSNVSSVSATFSDTALSATDTITVTFTTTTTVASGSFITVPMTDGSAFSTLSDFSAATATGSLTPYMSSGQVFNNYTPEIPGASAVDGYNGQLGSSLPAGTYTLIFSNVINPSTATQLGAGVATFQTMTYADYTVSSTTAIPTPVVVVDEPTEEEVVVPTFDTAALVELKIKDITKREALLKWAAFASTEFDVTYTVKLFKKNGDAVKTFTGLTEAKKQIAKASNLLKAGKSYKFKVKACVVDDEDTCTDWSAMKSFTMKDAM